MMMMTTTIEKRTATVCAERVDSLEALCYAPVAIELLDISNSQATRFRVDERLVSLARVHCYLYHMPQLTPCTHCYRHYELHLCIDPQVNIIENGIANGDDTECEWVDAVVEHVSLDNRFVRTPTPADRLTREKPFRCEYEDRTSDSNSDGSDNNDNDDEFLLNEAKVSPYYCNSTRGSLVKSYRCFCLICCVLVTTATVLTLADTWQLRLP